MWVLGANPEIQLVCCQLLRAKALPVPARLASAAAAASSTASAATAASAAPVIGGVRGFSVFTRIGVAAVLLR